MHKLQVRGFGFALLECNDPIQHEVMAQVNCNADQAKKRAGAYQDLGNEHISKRQHPTD
jgi:hypothetical protein